MASQPGDRRNGCGERGAPAGNPEVAILSVGRGGQRVRLYGLLPEYGGSLITPADVMC